MEKLILVIRKHLPYLCTIVGLVLVLSCWAAYSAGAQQSHVTSPLVRGTLHPQFETHTLLLQAVDQRQPLQVEMTYVPQGRWELDDRSGFFILDETGLDAYRNGAQPGSVAIAAGNDLPGEGRHLRATILTPDRTFYVLVYNDSPLPMNYTLLAENAFFTDEVGGQVIDVYNPPAAPSGPGVEEAPLIVVPGPTPTPTITPTPPTVRGMVLRGVLHERYDSAYFGLDVIDTGQPVQIEMTYDPPGQFMQDKGFEFNVFSDQQLANMLNNFILPWRAEDTTEGHLFVQPDGRFVWRAEIMDPYGHYTIVVSQWRYALQWLRFRLTVTNAVLVDESGEAIPFPRPTPTAARPMVTRRPPGEPYIVVEVRPLPTSTPSPTDAAQPSPDATSESPLPTPTHTPTPIP